MTSLKTALITGATGDIGRAITDRFILDGFQKIVISGLEDDILAEMSKSGSGVPLKASPGSTNPQSSCDLLEIIPLKADLTNPEEAEQLFAKAEELAGGEIDVVVNNAGITRDSFVMKMSDSNWRDVLTVNLEACFRICRAAFRPMSSRRRGRIINMSSVVGFMGNMGQANYCAAKAGLVGLSKALAHEFASRGITVNCVAPGFIDSAMTKSLPEKVKERLIDITPMKRMGTPQEVAEVVSFLASDGASFITGTTVHVNGGLYLA
ncbi:MAG: beta-ketoacyl-ACP reductase [Holosporales bacterium]|nr:beta-ketoacyl-ACP reductase [Holosporales bacterium]